MFERRVLEALQCDATRRSPTQVSSYVCFASGVIVGAALVLLQRSNFFLATQSDDDEQQQQ